MIDAFAHSLLSFIMCVARIAQKKEVKYEAEEYLI